MSILQVVLRNVPSGSDCGWRLIRRSRIILRNAKRYAFPRLVASTVADSQARTDIRRTVIVTR